MADERRLTTRMTAKWTDLSRDGQLPRHADLNPASFGKDLSNIAIIELSAEPGAAKLLYVGDILRNDGWSAGGVQTVAHYAPNSLLGLAAAKIPAVLAKRAPVTFGGTGVNGVSAILYRAILLPFSDDGETIGHVVAAINFREITAVQEYSEVEMPRAPVDKVSAAIAFSSRRLSFAPSAAKKPMQITIKQ